MKPETNKTRGGAIDLETYTHRTLTSRGANMIGGGYKIPGHLKEGRKTISNFDIAGRLAVFIKNSINYEVISVDNPTNSVGEVTLEIQLIKIYTQ